MILDTAAQLAHRNTDRAAVIPFMTKRTATDLNTEATEKLGSKRAWRKFNLVGGGRNERGGNFQSQHC